jgi:chromosome segregation ATPase
MNPQIITIAVGLFAGLCGAGGFWAGLRWLANHKTETTLGKVNLRTAEQLADDHIRNLVGQEYERLVAAKQAVIETLEQSATTSAVAAAMAKDAAVASAIAAEKSSGAAAVAAEKAATSAAVAAEKAATESARAAELASAHAIAAAEKVSKATIARLTKRITDLETAVEEMRATHKLAMADILADLEKIAAQLETVPAPVPPAVQEALTVARKHRKKAPEPTDQI